jgi:hypothetical protein
MAMGFILGADTVHKSFMLLSMIVAPDRLGGEMRKALMTLAREDELSYLYPVIMQWPGRNPSDSFTDTDDVLPRMSTPYATAIGALVLSVY